MGLGEVLVAQGVLDDASLAQATARQQASGTSLGKVLIEMGLANEESILSAVARQVGVTYLDGAPGSIDPDAAAMLPRDAALELNALPVAFTDDGALLVAISDPGNSGAIAAVGERLNMATFGALMPSTPLAQAIQHLSDASSQNGSAASAGQPAAVEVPPQQDVPESPASMWDAPEAPEPEPEPEQSALQANQESALEFEQETAVSLDDLLLEMVRLGGSDLHITAGIHPSVRLHGDLHPMEQFPICKPNELRKMIYGILTQRQREVFENDLELDVSYSIPRVARFRVNVFQQRDSIGSVMRVIPFEIQAIEDLGVPTQITNFAYMPRGFVLVTGPTGSGKSTTLASLIDVINRERACHVMTVEDPIEFLHSHKQSVVNQRELGTDTHSFADALKHVLRQDPDVILVGEMRDLETIQVALTAAETGHLVFGTLHTQDAPQTVDRIIDVFPPHQQEQIRVMLAGALQGVVCQQLLKTADGQGRVASCEVMIATPAIKNLIREGKTHQMYSSIQAGKSHGMITMDQSLANLVLSGKVTYETALERCNTVSDFNRLCGRA